MLISLIFSKKIFLSLNIFIFFRWWVSQERQSIQRKENSNFTYPLSDGHIQTRKRQSAIQSAIKSAIRKAAACQNWHTSASSCIQTGPKWNVLYSFGSHRRGNMVCFVRDLRIQSPRPMHWKGYSSPTTKGLNFDQNRMLPLSYEIKMLFTIVHLSLCF